MLDELSDSSSSSSYMPCTLSMAVISRTTMKAINIRTIMETLIMCIHLRKDAVDIITSSQDIHIYCKTKCRENYHTSIINLSYYCKNHKKVLKKLNHYFWMCQRMSSSHYLIPGRKPSIWNWNVFERSLSMPTYDASVNSEIVKFLAPIFY